MTRQAERWSLIVPVKRLEVAKTRLAVDVTARASLAVAMAVDTVAAALGSALVSAVVVVTDDRRARDALRGLAVAIVADVPDAGLNAALAHGAAGASGRVAALSSDLPSLRGEDLTTVLAQAASYDQSAVADWHGTGTTVLCARTAASFAPRFGVASLAAHLAGGAVDLTPQAPESVRRDVDTVDDLRAALAIGVGSETTRAINELSLVLD